MKQTTIAVDNIFLEQKPYVYLLHVRDELPKYTCKKIVRFFFISLCLCIFHVYSSYKGVHAFLIDLDLHHGMDNPVLMPLFIFGQM